MRIKKVFCTDDYYVSDAGDVLDSNMQPIKTNHNQRGYLIVVLEVDGKKKLFGVHTLVARAFCDGYEPHKQVNHKDGVKTNNHYTNLEWLTRKENTQHAIQVLGHHRFGSHNPQARGVLGINASEQVEYAFPSIIEAALFFANGNRQKARHIQTSIWRVLQHYPGRHTYRKCKWIYDDNASNERTHNNAEP
jgi:hypothetical protein